MTDQEAAAEYRRHLQEYWDVTMYGGTPPEEVTESDGDSE